MTTHIYLAPHSEFFRSKINDGEHFRLTIEIGDNAYNKEPSKAVKEIYDFLQVALTPSERQILSDLIKDEPF